MRAGPSIRWRNSVRMAFIVTFRLLKTPSIVWKAVFLVNERGVDATEDSTADDPFLGDDADDIASGALSLEDSRPPLDDLTALFFAESKRGTGEFLI